MWNAIKEMYEQLIDNDTLIIIGAFVIAIISPEHRQLVVGGLLGYMGKALKSSTKHE